MKKILLLISGLILMFTIAGCQNAKDAVKQSFEKDMESFKKGDFSGLSISKENVEILQMFTEGYKKMTYTINKVTEEDGGKKIVVNVTMKYPDLAELPAGLEEVMKESAPELEGKSKEEILAATKNTLKSMVDVAFKQPDLKFAEGTFDVTYVKNGDKWDIPDQGNEAFIKAISLNFN